MTIGTDHFQSLSSWGRVRSTLTLLAILAFFGVLLSVNTTRGYALVGLAILITVMLHEAGHFIAAKWSGMKATEFFVGFGPRIWSFRKGETEYGIKAIPLGGYVKIIGMTSEDEVAQEDEPRTFRQGKHYHKLIVILAGVTVNILLAYILIFTTFVGKGVAVDAATSKPIIEMVSPNSPSAKAGLKSGDEIVSVNGEDVSSFEELVIVIQSFDIDEKVSVEYLRNGAERTAHVTLAALPLADGTLSDRAYLGVTQEAQYETLGFGEAFTESGRAMYRIIETSIGAMTDRFSASGIAEYSEIVVNGEHERQDRPSSVAGIVNTGGQLVNQDIWYLFSIIAVVNIFLALFNLVPILPLDGGHVPLIMYEWIGSKIMKRPVKANYKKMVPIATAFIGLMLILTVSALWLDLLQITS